MRKIIIPVEFEIGTLAEIGLGGLKQPWVDTEHNGVKLALTCGAGLGNSLIEASASRDGRSVYARGSILAAAQELFTALSSELA